MENNEVYIEEMNKFLKGIHMGATTFKDYLEKVEDTNIKVVILEIIESFKRHEEAITHRIEDLGGNASDSIGIGGMMGEFFEKMKLMVATNDKEILERAIKAVEMGIKQGNEFIEENMDLPKSLMNDIKGTVADYDNHLRKLQEEYKKS